MLLLVDGMDGHLESPTGGGARGGHRTGPLEGCNRWAVRLLMFVVLALGGGRANGGRCGRF